MSNRTIGKNFSRKISLCDILCLSVCARIGLGIFDVIEVKITHEAIPKIALLRMPIEIVPKCVRVWHFIWISPSCCSVLHNPLVMGETSATLSPLLMDIFQHFVNATQCYFYPQAHVHTESEWGFHWFASKCIEMDVFPLAFFLFWPG